MRRKNCDNEFIVHLGRSNTGRYSRTSLLHLMSKREKYQCRRVCRYHKDTHFFMSLAWPKDKMRLSPHVFETLEATFLFLRFVCRHTDSTQCPLPRIASRTYVFVSFRPTYSLSALFRKWSYMSLVQPSPFWFRYNILVLRKWERLSILQ